MLRRSVTSNYSSENSSNINLNENSRSTNTSNELILKPNN